MPEHVLNQVEDAFADRLASWPALAGWNVIVLVSADIAIEDVDLPALLLVTRASSFGPFEYQSQTVHSADIEVEAVCGAAQGTRMVRQNRNALAHVVAAVDSDRSLGINLQELEEKDIAPAEPRGRDVDSASLLFHVEFFTSRGDWFNIVQNP